MNRCCGVLLPVFSIPSPYGIGTMGKAAYNWIDFLHQAGQQLWQVLPIGPTSYGDSPYQSFSAFAGNPYFIDLEMLCEIGLLKRDECVSLNGLGYDIVIDYEKQYRFRYDILRKAFGRFHDHKRLQDFCAEHEWAKDYALFMAIKDEQMGAPWTQWPLPLRTRNGKALAKKRKELHEEVDYYIFLQMIFFEQWKQLSKYAKEQGVSIIGDIPIYVAMDSADTWANPDLFQLDAQCRPTAVAGCPPDAFTADGQLWGNPLYRWDVMARDGYRWWLDRIRASLELFDAVRIDHFRGFESYYAIPYGEVTAKNGKWVKGPGKGLIAAIKQSFPNVQIIAEDLGFLTQEVKELLSYSGFPGMKIIQFAFDSREKSDYIPFKYSRNCVVYTGTHDNETTLGWIESVSAESLQYAKSYLMCEDADKDRCVDLLITLALSSAADWAVIPIQDWLHLGREARINTPATIGENWRWRMKPDVCDAALAHKMRDKAVVYERFSEVQQRHFYEIPISAI